MAETAKLAPSGMSEGGGLLDDVDVTFKSCRFVKWDYAGKVPTSIPAAEVVMELEGVEEGVKQYWSAGNANDWMPGPDGKTLVAIGKATAIVSSSNLGILLTSIVNAGYPEDKLSDDISELDGMECHVARVPAPKRSGLTRAPRADGRAFEDTILTVSKIHKLPWEKKAAKGGGKGKGGGKAKVEAASGTAEDVATASTDALMAVLAENPDGVAKQQIPGLVFKAIGDSPLRNAVVKLVFTDDFLKEGPWEFADGKVKLG